MDEPVLNALTYSKLLTVAKIGELMPAKSGERTDLQPRTSASTRLFRRETLARYRKVAVNQDKIDDYYEAAKEEDDAGRGRRTARFGTCGWRAGASRKSRTPLVRANGQ